MKAVVTGGAGFIGHHLVKRLVLDGWFVHVIDNLSTGSMKNLEGIDETQIQFHLIDIAYDPIPDLEAVDAVFHLAAPVSVPESLEIPSKYRDGIQRGSRNMIEWSYLHMVKSFTAASTAAVYGEPDQLPIKETFKLAPLSPYAEYKLEMESYMKKSHRSTLKCTALRFFNVFGEGQRATGGYVSAVPIFLEQYQSYKPITVTGDGTQTRDWIYVGDIVNAMLKASEAKYKPEMPIYNVGSGNETQVIEVAEALGGELVHIEKRLEPMRSVADISAITKELNWRSRTNLLSWIKLVK